jgi:deazaflavin-dependent oxidoreductase (nitroreductase family)
MGLVQTLGYEVKKSGAAQAAVQHMAATRAAAWFLGRTQHHIDKAVLRLSRGNATFGGLVGGLAVLTVTTTGARTGLRRRVPLLGIPMGDDIALIGTRFGQSGTPGWYHNMRADPKVEVAYQNRVVLAFAREADDEERRAVWDRAGSVYAGFHNYASRIRNRDIHIMILSAATPNGV